MKKRSLGSRGPQVSVKYVRTPSIAREEKRAEYDS